MASQTPAAHHPAAETQGQPRPELPPVGADGGGWSTRRWLRVGVSASLAVLVLLGALGFWVFAHSSAVNNRLVDVSSPALIAAVRLESGLVNQETGIRGYGLTGQAEFLAPYEQGIAQQRDAVAELRRLSTGERSGADLDLVLARAEAWQSQVARPVAAAPPGSAAPTAGRQTAEGKAAFDALRAAMALQQEHLQADRADSRAALQSVRTLRNVVFSAIALIILLLAALVFEGLRRGVTRPLEHVSADAERVARGDFSHPITPTGPADLRQLAAVVEAMRGRLAHELLAKEAARQVLDAQTVDLRRSNSELEQFAYVASHDLQEPLRKVASFCQLLQRRYGGSLDARADQYIEFAVDGANRMQTLINDLLAFSRVGRVHASYTPVDLEQVFARTVDSLSIAIADNEAVITHDPLPRISGDATQLGMLLQNLLSNAVKFRSPDRAPRIHLEAVRDGDLWRCAVTDNGIGIDGDFVDKVFVIFQRLHTRDAYPGNGIGLAMCKKIVEFHGGTIEVDLTHTPGTRLVFTLPVEESVEPQESAVAPADGRTEGHLVAPRAEAGHS
ncbi:histidine kinase [Kitasatospora herbaricolor]|uniref:sensor histidine kinase n=1 Tax=Kitasatospora herbaricolor TaxID=68217 RepID=UPI0019B29F19|nr:sensor histidine kinase [Kitasatospora herbaricolor]MDQ0312338.1 signal transduction histidine kinase [Kitasatospora herbaricolor]GGV15125.1 histidine kinase [Kitasatospora herbaricolor]